MKKVTIISDGLVREEYFVNALDVLREHIDFEYQVFHWHEDLDKEAFQEKMLYIENNGPDFYEPEEQLLEALKTTDYLFAHIAPINEAMLSVCENLKLVGICRGGTENVDLEYCYQNEIPVIRTVKNAIATAEFTLGLMLSVTRNIANSYHALTDGKWQKSFFNDGYRKSLSEMKVGVIGLGHIGIEVSRMLLEIGADVYGYHSPLTEEKKQEVNLPITYTDLESLFETCDIITVHLRLDSKTENMIDYSLLSKMKKDAYLINTARAKLVNEQDLIKAIEAKEILGAALDVFWEEPLDPSHPLLKHENVLVTPHIAGDTDVIDRAPTLLFREVSKFLNGQPTQMLIKDKYMKNSF